MMSYITDGVDASDEDGDKRNDGCNLSRIRFWASLNRHSEKKKLKIAKF